MTGNEEMKKKKDRCIERVVGLDQVYLRILITHVGDGEGPGQGRNENYKYREESETLKKYTKLGLST